MLRSLPARPDRQRYGRAIRSDYDFLRAYAQGNNVEGGTDNDSVYGQSGDDWPRRSDGPHAIAGDSGTDACTCSVGSDELKGCNP